MNSFQQGHAASGLQAALNSITNMIQKKLQIQFLFFYISIKYFSIFLGVFLFFVKLFN